jgi:hypothetical protein
MSVLKIFDRMRNKLAVDGDGDNFPLLNVGCSLGVVMDTDDPLQQGRIRVYCAAFNDDPKKPQYLPWAAYVSPFGGSIRNPEHVKGHDPDKEYSTEGTTQYGFWAIPEVGANVLVTCINGDPRRRVWLGCLYEHQETGGFMHGLYDWDDGTVDGPFCGLTPNDDTSSSESPEFKKIQPLYDNQSEAFNEERDSAEWKTRAADFAGMVNIKQDSKGTNEDLQSNEDDSWVKEKLGAMGYDWTAFKNLGAYLASKVIGFVSPGLHSISMDDRAFNSRIRIRTTAGNQIILDDTNERIYVSTHEGKSWVELDKCGNIDMYGERRISIHSEKDLNLSSDETVRIKGNKGVHIYSGDRQGEYDALEYTPKEGEIRFHAAHDIHMLTERTYRHYAAGDTKIETRGNTHLTTHELFAHATPSPEYTSEGPGGGIYMMGDSEIYMKTMNNTISLNDSIGIQNISNLNLVFNAGGELIQAAGLGPTIVNNECSGGLFSSPVPPIQSSSPEVLENIGGAIPYGLSLGDFGCEIPTGGGPLFSLDVNGNINLQTIGNTIITKGLDALGNKFSTSIQAMNDNVDEFADKYNQTIASIQDQLLKTEIYQYALRAAALVGKLNAEAGFALQYSAKIVAPPSLSGFTSVIIGNLLGKIHLPDLKLPDLCVYPPLPQISISYSVQDAIDEAIDGVFSMSLDTNNPPTELMGASYSILEGGSGGDCHSALSDINFAVWPNRVPGHEPWARVLKIDGGDTVNDKSSEGYMDNVDWIDQFNNEGEDGRKPIGVFEGEEEIERGEFWRR